MWFKLAMLVDGKTEPQKEMACSGSQRKPGEVLEASPQPDPPPDSQSWGRYSAPFVSLFICTLSIFFPQRKNLIFVRTQTSLGPIIFKPVFDAYLLVWI